LCWSAGNAVVGIEPVEGLLGAADGVALEVGMGVAEPVGEAGVVVVVAGVQVAAESVGDLVHRPLLEFVAAEGGWGLQVRQQLLVAVGQVPVLVGLVEFWQVGWGGV
jgi:hypothetical protein